MKPLAATVLLVLIGSLAFSFAPDTIQPEIDTSILSYIAVVYTIGVALALAYTRQWSLIGCGLIATMIGDALLYSWFSVIDFPRDPVILDIARSCFIVGGTQLLIGLAVWKRSHRHADAVPEWETP